jgi:hypothetical protein
VRAWGGAVFAEFAMGISGLGFASLQRLANKWRALYRANIKVLVFYM